MIQGLPSVTFELVFIGGAKHQYGPIQYQLPANVNALHIHYLMDDDQDKQNKVRRRRVTTKEMRSLFARGNNFSAILTTVPAQYRRS
ncbi:DUF3492 domain-containing protein [Vibrio sp. PP-XX7]